MIDNNYINNGKHILSADIVHQILMGFRDLQSITYSFKMKIKNHKIIIMYR